MSDNMGNGEPATNRELNRLWETVRQIDKDGTRGTVGALSLVQAQLTDVIKDQAEAKGDLAALRQEMQTRFDKHVAQHEDDKKARNRNRKWIVGIGIAGLASMSGVAVALFDILSRVH